VDRLHILFRFTADEARNLIQWYLSANPDPMSNNSCWIQQKAEAELAAVADND
jgi:hypothetical protein